MKYRAGDQLEKLPLVNCWIKLRLLSFSEIVYHPAEDATDLFPNSVQPDAPSFRCPEAAVLRDSPSGSTWSIVLL